ncbi:MAG: SRPBCC family protein [Candidatus Dormiibacterota bacterium]
MPRIRLVTDIAASPAVCFDVARDVGVHLASSRSEQVVGGVRAGMMSLHDEVTWRAWHFGVPWRMTSKIVEYDRPHHFVDAMQRGPFGRWRHRHIFETTDAGTRMVDDVDYASPFGVLGAIVDGLVLERYMTSLLRRRNQHVGAVAEGRSPRPASSPPRDGRSSGGGRARRVDVCGHGEATIHCEPAEVLEFVLDVDQYRKADHKIGRVHFARRDGNHGEVRHSGRILGVPAPAATLAFELTPSSRLDFRGVSLPWPLRGFHGSFTCAATPSGTQVVHREFTFGPVAGPLVRLAFGRLLALDTQAEVVRMKRLLEAPRKA